MLYEDLAIIIVAAGYGKRLGLNIPKAYVKLKKKSLLFRVLNTLSENDLCRELYIVVPPIIFNNNNKYIKSSNFYIEGKRKIEFSQTRLTFLKGGLSRNESVNLALKKINFDIIRKILIHDVARPLTPIEIFHKVINKLYEGCKAVIPVLPIYDTIKLINKHGIIVKTINREFLKLSQTPQGFDLNFLNSVFHKVKKHIGNNYITDESIIFEQSGQLVHTVYGSQLSIKITTKIDLIIAKALLDELKKKNN